MERSKEYIDDLDLKDVQTLGEIIRITVDAGNASYGYDQRVSDGWVSV